MLAILFVILNIVSTQGNTASKGRVIDYLRPMLKSVGSAARIYYAGECRPAEFDTSKKLQLLFPTVDLQPPAHGATGADAIRQVFRADGNVRVTQDQSGIVRIAIGNVQTALLQTKLASLTFDSRARYSAAFAMLNIENAPELRAAENTLQINPIPLESIDIIGGPTPGESHLPQSMRGLSAGAALDSIARTFKGIRDVRNVQTGWWKLSLRAWLGVLSVYSTSTRTNLRDPTDSTAGCVAVHNARGSSTIAPSTRTPRPDRRRSAARRLSANPARTKTSATRTLGVTAISANSPCGNSFRCTVRSKCSRASRAASFP